MNKYQKAWMTVSALSHTSINFKCYRDEMDIQLIQQLVEKETPKKPIDIEFGPCGDLMLCCPNCHHGVVPSPTYHGNKYYHRCPFCGQKLKEGDEDEK